ncbi:hypothetical protein NO559_09570 [Dasania sp. GY-MA-18]|uniref:Uncharacterized protein n=1 Tax=Dasania phycosphaerae TaxID=2950436 RepID=A0A9J6RN74_9GAMM|nr:MULTISPECIES: hypothetical protein [Dasania]MCR8923022.1 hypothetical protein [Dasania sp. GY-MA-18]MCZ0865453.1 hypothetical protein [Dasania phycosphaerae]MCZ0869178.1 hypothetical protein [Dasania phycosphaerae]
MPPSNSDIFVDRRKSQQPHSQPCRRGGSTAMDSRPWWLKTTYVNPPTPNKSAALGDKPKQPDDKH